MIIDVLVYRAKESLRMRVNFELRYGIWSEPLVKECTTLPKQDNDRFIFFVYSRVLPIALLFLTFSEPAKSMKQSLHRCYWPLHTKFL